MKCESLWQKVEWVGGWVGGVSFFANVVQCARVERLDFFCCVVLFFCLQNKISMCNWMRSLNGPSNPVTLQKMNKKDFFVGHHPHEC